MKILFLSANPPGSVPLKLDKEVKRVEECLQRSKLNGRFKLVTKWAVDSDTLRRALLEEQPDVVHFSGHGEGQSGLVILGENGQAKPATGEALSGLFRQFPKIKCVLLNACFAEVQAKAIVQHVEYVIGMKQAVRDDAAIAFAAGFYDALGYETPIEVAFEFGRSAMQFEERASFCGTTRKLIPVAEEVEPLPDHLIPVLLKKMPGSTNSAIYSNRSSEASSFSQKLRAEKNITQTDAVKIYRERVQEFLRDRKLTPIETAQLAIFAKFLGLSGTEANWILQEEQNQQSDAPPAPTERSWFQKMSHVKKSLFAGVAILAISGGLLAYRQTTVNPPNGRFLQNMLSNRCIDVAKDAKNTNGAALALWDCETSNAGLTNQKWILGSNGLIRNSTSGKCIGVQGANNTNGSPLVLSECETSEADRENTSLNVQRWTVGSDGFIRNQLSGKCIDVSGAPGITNGARLAIWDCETSGKNRDNETETDQRWQLVSTESQ